MRGSIKHLFLLLAVGSAGILAWNLQNKPIASIPEKQEMAAAVAPAVSTGIHLVQYEGERIRWEMKTPETVREQEGWNRVQAPRLTLFQGQAFEPVWVAAQGGRVNTFTREMEFQDGVEVTTNQGHRLSTELLRFDPEKRMLYTDQPFRMVSEALRVSGVGFRLFQERRRLEILQKVHLSVPGGLKAMTG
ncbi:MAG: LPS export ABC transporter periplasmic protein LptC [Magnetococcales bacterium]|nr:LPS export ABC transporter periplasmic protein LptC [Magnetococcales bacterium]